MTLDELRNAALDIFHHALRAVDARSATRSAVSCDHSVLRVVESEFNVTDRPIYVVAIGKAALSMTLGLNDALGDQISSAVISTSALTTPLPSTHKVFLGGHPLPNQQSLEAAAATFELINEANCKKAVVIFLISGGGSSMMEWPVSEAIKLEDLQEANRQLVTCGATIREVNAVRRSLSAVKGGRLAQRVTATDIVTLIVSDTNRGDESSVASGPTLLAPVDVPDAQATIEKYGLVSSLPLSVLDAIRRHRHTESSAQHEVATPCFVLLDNSVAIEAARQKAVEFGFTTTVEDDLVEQPIDEGSELLLGRVNNRLDAQVCSISGGEFACRVRGSGRGGRNLETVLRCAIKLDQDKNKSAYHTVVLSAGTDGIDGSSSAAGAIADEYTIARARTLGLDADDYLRRSDSHAFFEALGDLIVTGSTGTNVRDLRLLLRSSRWK